MQALLVAVVIVTAFSVAGATTPVLAQNTTGENMTMKMDSNMTSMGGNMTQPLEDENMTLSG